MDADRALTVQANWHRDIRWHTMTPAIEKPASSKVDSGKTVVSQDTRLDVSCPRCIWDGSRFRSREDEIIFRRWRLRFFFLYGAIAVLLFGGFAIFADRPGTATLIAATAPTHAAMASADAIRHPHR